MRRAYASVLAGETLGSIARGLNTEGFTTNRGGEWKGQNLRAVLLKPRNAGLRTYGGEIVGPGSWTPVVDEETFRKVERLLNNPARRTGKGGREATSLLTGFALCGKCGATINASKSEKGKPIYKCRHRSCVQHQREWTDEYVTRLAVARLLLPNRGVSTSFAEAAWGPQASQGAELQQEAADLRQRMEDLALDYADGRVTRWQMQAATDRMRERLAVVEKALSKSSAAKALEGISGTTESEVRAEWDALPTSRQRAILALLFHEIRLMPRGYGRRKPDPAHVLITWPEEVWAAEAEAEVAV